jgi:hypothetical protein
MKEEPAIIFSIFLDMVIDRSSGCEFRVTGKKGIEQRAWRIE